MQLRESDDTVVHWNHINLRFGDYSVHVLLYLAKPIRLQLTIKRPRLSARSEKITAITRAHTAYEIKWRNNFFFFSLETKIKVLHRWDEPSISMDGYKNQLSVYSNVLLSSSLLEKALKCWIQKFRQSPYISHHTQIAIWYIVPWTNISKWTTIENWLALKTSISYPQRILLPRARKYQSKLITSYYQALRYILSSVPCTKLFSSSSINFTYFAH